jgi:hypothetical protein
VANRLPSAKQYEIDDELKNSHWRMVYAGVTVFTALVILLLLLFSRQFSG